MLRNPNKPRKRLTWRSAQVSVSLYKAANILTRISGFGESMASFSSSSLPTKFLLGFGRSNAGAKIPAFSISGIGAKSHYTPRFSSFRHKDALRSQIRQRLSSLFAKDAKRSGGDSLGDEVKGTEASQGPPVLTILAVYLNLNSGKVGSWVSTSLAGSLFVNRKRWSSSKILKAWTVRKNDNLVHLNNHEAHDPTETGRNRSEKSFTITAQDNGTINRHVINFLEAKAIVNDKPYRGVKTSDIIVDETRNLWFRLFTPTKIHKRPVIPLPVIVFFHGGRFSFLTADALGYDKVYREFVVISILLYYFH
ncbi:hypothetical protein NE237_009032 [Protea cynaroides]|uniref:Uncharacterized protein n=1 Tax=Protea cynaroides TaxID=273540 RepID=A0A9Q0R086_9MAGN|nr:hypothetical protein NE237_009032 [Protea cynaroides]